MRIVLSRVLTGLLVAAPAFAQLSGVYTVDNTQPTGGTNYASLAAAAADVVAQGVNGPVTFQVVATATPYQGMHLPTFAGTGAANPVTFTGVGNPSVLGTVAGAGGLANINQCIRLGINSTVGTGPTYVTIEGLTVSTGVTGATASGSGIQISGSANITVRNCVVHTSSVGIYAIGSTNVTIEDNEVSGCQGGPGNTIVTATGVISNQYACGIGIETNSHSAIIRRNRVHDCLQRGIFFGANADAAASTNCIVVNNMVWNCTGLLGTQTLYGGGIVARRTPGAVMSNNTVLMNTTSVNAPAMTLQLTFLLAEVSNNLLKQDGVGGVCFRYEAATTPAPTIFNYNLYDTSAGSNVGAVAAVLHPTLAAWQALPANAGKELNTLVGAAGFVSPTAPIDVHVTAASAGFQNGSVVAAVPDDIDGQPRVGTPTRGADEPNPNGIFANFTGTPLAGGAPLTVNFTDTTFSSDPGGVTAWLWDFENDGTIDSFLQNPSHTYLVPGTYTVAMTATDATNGSNTKTRVGYVVVGPYLLDVFTTGGGAGDLTITPVPHLGAQSSVIGYLLISFTTTQPVGSGVLFGITPDSFTWPILLSPAAPGDLLHWVYVPGLFPDVPFGVPAGFLSFLAGLSADFVQVDLGASFNLVNVSNVDRVTF